MSGLPLASIVGQQETENAILCHQFGIRLLYTRVSMVSGLQTKYQLEQFNAQQTKTKDGDATL